MGGCNIFREELGIRYPDHGHALWDPDPRELYNSVEVGDVGFIRRGYFYRLFNALLPRDPPSDPDTRDDNGPMYPPRLEPKIPQHIRRDRDNLKDFHSKSVTMEHSGHSIYASGPDNDVRVTVSCSGRQGALLSLPFPAACEDTVAQGDFGKWLVKNIDCCMKVAEDLGVGVNRMEDIILVTGRHLARSWVNVVFSEYQAGAQLSFVVQVSGNSGVHLEGRSATGADLKLGPSGKNLPENQCIFIRGYRVVRILNVWPRLQKLAGPSSDKHESESGPGTDLELLSIPAETDDPLHVLLKYIAEQAPDCDMALVHDNDLDFLVNEPFETGQPDALLEYLQNYPPTIRRVPCELLPGNEEGSETKTEIASVATLSNAVFDGPHEDQARSPPGFETPSEQAEHLIGGIHGLDLNPPLTRDYMETHGHIAQALRAPTTAQYKNVNVGDKHKWNALHLALKDGDGDLAQELVESGADVNAQDDSELTPLHLASSGGHVGIAQVLIEHGADVNSQDYDKSTPLHLASSSGHIEIAQVLIEHDADVNAQDHLKSTPLHLASSNGHAEIAQVLIEHGANVDAQDYLESTPLNLAFRDGHTESAQVLIEHGADVNARDYDKSTPLHRASRKGLAKFARVLIKHGAGANAQDYLKSTPLHLASMGGHVEIAQVLIEHGADVNAQDNFKSTPLYHATRGGHVEIAQMLIEHGADVNAQDKDKWTLLHLASRGGHVEFAQMLIKHGADVDAQNYDFRSTPLHLASEAGHLGVVRVLLEFGANTNMLDFVGRTPLQRTSSKGLRAIARLFLDHGSTHHSTVVLKQDLWP